MANIQTVLGNNIRRLRNKNGWSQVFLADKLDVSVSFISIIESGQRGVSLALVENIADVFNVSVPYLFTDQNSPDSQFGFTDSQIDEMRDELKSLFSSFIDDFFYQKRLPKNDVLKSRFPLYHINRTPRGMNKPFNDKSHIIYVNEENRGDAKFCNLIPDFSCSQTDDMKNKVIAKKAKLLKETEQKEIKIGRAMEELIADEKIEIAARLLAERKMNESEITDFFCFTPEQMKSVLSLCKQQNAVNA